MITLYQFPISHYCEKIRWALDYKKVDYQVVNMLPGLHAKKAKRLAVTAEVPILVHDDKVIQNSSDIITYIDETFNGPSLTPENKEQRDSSLEWESFVDQELGPFLRVYFYHTLLDYPDLIISFFSHKGPWYGKIFLRFIFPRMRVAMKRMMKINNKSAAEAKERVEKAIDVLNKQLSRQPFLAGNEFSRADLAAAALLGPVIKSEKYGLPWPATLPEPLQTTVNEWNASIPWAHKLYEDYR